MITSYFEHNHKAPQLDVVEFTVHAPAIAPHVVEALTHAQRETFRRFYNAQIDARLQKEIPVEAA